MSDGCYDNEWYDHWQENLKNEIFTPEVIKELGLVYESFRTLGDKLEGMPVSPLLTDLVNIGLALTNPDGVSYGSMYKKIIDGIESFKGNLGCLKDTGYFPTQAPNESMDHYEWLAHWRDNLENKIFTPEIKEKLESIKEIFRSMEKGLTRTPVRGVLIDLTWLGRELTKTDGPVYQTITPKLESLKAYLDELKENGFFATEAPERFNYLVKTRCFERTKRYFNTFDF